MRFLLNILWLITGGLVNWASYMLASLLLCCTIVGIPFALQTFKIGNAILWPFGREIIDKPDSQGCLNLFMNLLWLLLGGIAIALEHLACALGLAITIIGIPFALQHLKLAMLALMPFGKEFKNKVS